MEKMAKEIRLTRKSFSKSIKKLESLKYIIVTKNSSWDCYKYKPLDKAHGKKLPIDGKLLPTGDGKKLPTNDGNLLPTQIKTSNIKETNKEKENGKLPSWLNKESWDEWTEHRKEIKKKQTPLAIKKQLSFLEKRKETHVAIIEQAIRNGWTGLYDIRNQQVVKQEPERPQGRIIT
jgi:hypothetical protein